MENLAEKIEDAILEAERYRDTRIAKYRHASEAWRNLERAKCEAKVEAYLEVLAMLKEA